MTLKNIILLLIALGTAGMTAMFANNWISSERAAFLASAPKQVTETATVEVLVVNAELKAGNFVRKDNLKWQPWPEEGSAEVYALKGQRDIKDFIGAVVRTSIMPGQPITTVRSSTRETVGFWPLSFSRAVAPFRFLLTRHQGFQVSFFPVTRLI